MHVNIKCDAIKKDAFKKYFLNFQRAKIFENIETVGFDMRIIFKRNEKVVIVSFDTVSENFESNYERNKFFRELYGWKQVVPGEGKNYNYRRQGLLDNIPHKKISNSVFMIALEHMKRMEAFFDQWQEKVEYDMIEVILERERILKDLRRRRDQL